MQNDEIKKMFECAVHVGHRTQKWNPRMKRFIHGERHGIHIINLEKTQECLEKALAFLAKNVAERKTILFVSTKPQSIKLLEEAAKASGQTVEQAKKEALKLLKKELGES